MENKNSAPLPYKEIGEYPKSVSHGNVIKRFIDGLGYRYYWATESLRESDISYRIGEGSRSSLEILEHILDLSGFILSVTQQKHNGGLKKKEKFDFMKIRHKTLYELKEASRLIGRMTDEEVKSLDIKIQQGNNQFSLPLWNLLNGPISDAIYHIGQVVSFRRASGNPINSNVDIFTGKNKE